MTSTTPLKLSSLVAKLRTRSPLSKRMSLSAKSFNKWARYLGKDTLLPLLPSNSSKIMLISGLIALALTFNQSPLGLGNNNSVSSAGSPYCLSQVAINGSIGTIWPSISALSDRENQPASVSSSSIASGVSITFKLKLAAKCTW